MSCAAGCWVYQMQFQTLFFLSVSEPEAAKSFRRGIAELLARNAVNRSIPVVAQNLDLVKTILRINDNRLRAVVSQVLHLKSFGFRIRTGPAIELKFSATMPGTGNDKISAIKISHIANAQTVKVQERRRTESSSFTLHSFIRIH